jgi:hypothetical protein
MEHLSSPDGCYPNCPACKTEDKTTNTDRAALAQVAVKAFQLECNVEDEDVLCDLICNLQHWAVQNNYDFEAALIRATNHFMEETKEQILNLTDKAVSAKRLLKTLKRTNV